MNPQTPEVESLAENILAMLRSQGYHPNSKDEEQIQTQLRTVFENGNLFKEFERVGGALGAAQNYLETGDIFHEKDEGTLVKDIGLLGADIAPVSTVLRILWVFAVALNIGMFAFAPIAFGVFTSDAITVFYSVAYLIYGSLIVIPLVLLQIDKAAFIIFLREHKKTRILIGLTPLLTGLVNTGLGFIALVVGQLAYNIALLNEQLRYFIFFILSSISMVYSWPFSSRQIEAVSKDESILADNKGLMRFILLNVVYLGLPALLVDPIYVFVILFSREQLTYPSLLLPFSAFFWGHVILSFILIYYLFMAKDYFVQRKIMHFKFSIVNFLFTGLLFLRFWLLKRTGISVDQKIMIGLYGFLLLTFPWSVFSGVSRRILRKAKTNNKILELKDKATSIKNVALSKYQETRQSATAKLERGKTTALEKIPRQMPASVVGVLTKGKNIGNKIGNKSKEKFTVWGKEFKKRFTVFPLGNNPYSLDNLIFWTLTCSVFVVVEVLRYEFLHPKNAERDYFSSPGSTLISFTQGFDFVISFFYLWLFLEISLAIILIRNSISLSKGIGVGGLVAEILNRAMYAWLFQRMVSDLEYWNLLTSFQIELAKGMGYFILGLHVLRWILNFGRTDPLETWEFALIQFVTIIVFLLVWSLWGQYFLPRLLRLLF